MATSTQRAQALIDAWLNTSASAAQMNRVGEAWAYLLGQSAHYTTLSAAQKAEFLVRASRAHMIALVRSADTQAAADAAADAAETDLPETP